MKKITLILLALTAFAGHLNATLILSDQFSYTNGPVVLSFGSPWTNHSGGFRQMLVTNEQLQVVGTNNTLFSEDINATFAGAPYDTNGVPTTNLYSSMTINCVALPTAGGGYIAHFKDLPAGFSFRARIFANTTGAAAGRYRIGIGNGSAAATPSPQLAVDLDTNTTYTVVTRYNLMTGQSTLWLNPTNETDASTDALDVITNLAPISTYAFRQAGNAIGVFLCDDLFVGTRFTDVAGTNHPPFITGIPNQRVTLNTSTTPLPFTFGDKETAVGSLVLTRASSDTVLVPTANIVITPGGSSGSRFVTVTPAAGQQGVATITISVTDGDSNVSTSVFTVTVGAPSISDTADQETAKNTTTAPVSFTVGDSESPASSLTMTGSSSNTNLVTDANIVFGGSGSNRTVTITPEPNATGLSTITLTVNDGTSTSSDSFTLTVYPTHLGVIRCDNFNRANGPLVDGTGVWLSYAGTPVGGTVITNNRVLLTQTMTEKVCAVITNTGPDGPSFGTTNGFVLYASFNVNFSELPSSALSNFFASFKDDTGGTGFINHRARVLATTSNAAPGNFRLGIANSVNSVSNNGIFATDLVTNKTHFVVVRFNVGTGFSSLWVNPVSKSSPSLEAPDTFNPFILAVTTFSFQQDANHGTCVVDNLRVGGTFDDVVSVPSLSVALSGADVKLSWPITCADQTLESTPSVTPASWSAVAQTPAVVGSLNVVTITNAAGTSFYRLRD